MKVHMKKIERFTEMCCESLLFYHSADITWKVSRCDICAMKRVSMKAAMVWITPSKFLGQLNRFRVQGTWQVEVRRHAQTRHCHRSCLQVDVEKHFAKVRRVQNSHSLCERHVNVMQCPIGQHVRNEHDVFILLMVGCQWNKYFTGQGIKICDEENEVLRSIHSSVIHPLNLVLGRPSFLGCSWPLFGFIEIFLPWAAPHPLADEPPKLPAGELLQPAPDEPPQPPLKKPSLASAIKKQKIAGQ